MRPDELVILIVDENPARASIIEAGLMEAGHSRVHIVTEMHGLMVAQEQGFAGREGVALDLLRDVSWSNIRDRLAFRQFDAAHLLGP